MNDAVIYSVSALGVLVALFLIGFIIKKWQFLQAKKKSDQENLAKLEKIQKDRYEYIKHSLIVITDALVNDQMDLIEGAIRVKALLDYFDPELHQETSYQVFTEIHNKTEHIPIKEAWKALDKPAKRKHEQFMLSLVNKEQQRIRDGAKALHGLLVAAH
jgi:exopolyphosphatase/pppGpp-phosphohydrolase